VIESNCEKKEERNKATITAASAFYFQFISDLSSSG